MGFLRRRRARAGPRAGYDEPCVSSVRLIEGADPRAEDAAAAAALRRIADEAVLLQDLAEDMLEGVHERRSLSELAPPSGALVSRFVELRRELPDPADARLRAIARALGETLDHHALVLSYSLDLLGDLRPERVSEQIDRVEGLGAPALRLIALRDQLAGGLEPAGRAD
jgi:hypothetical protein